MTAKVAVYLGCFAFWAAMSASLFINKKVINILVGKKSIIPKATKPAILTIPTIPTTPIAWIRGSYICK
jgi:hypothetical protein